MLHSLNSVTYCVPDLLQSKTAFEHWLQYRTVESGQVPAQLSDFWQAGEVTGRPYAVLQPASLEPVFIRLIEAPNLDAYQPLRTFGWNAAEIHVQDVHELADSLKDSPFTIIGGPRDLLDDGTVIALQVLGPGGEVLYLTQINQAETQETYGRAESAIGRIFIAVQGVVNLQQSIDFYQAVSAGTTVPKPFNIRVLAQAHGLDWQKTKFEIASVILQQRFRIEMDQYPPGTTPRPRAQGELPPGLCMASFIVADADQLAWPKKLEWIKGPPCLPYCRNRTALAVGPSGEWIELIEQAGDAGVAA